MTVQTNKVIAKFRKDYQVSPFLIKKTHLDFQLFEHFVLVNSNLQFYKNPEHFGETLPYLELVFWRLDRNVVVQLLIASLFA